MADLSGFWDDQAPCFDEEPDHGLRDPAIREAWTDLLRAHLPAAPASVADVGCGTGTLAVLLASEGYEVSGLDFSREMIELSTAKAAAEDVEVRFVVADATSPPWPEASFDCVLSRHVLWAVPDPALALDRWLALLRPSGRLVLVEGHRSTGAGLSAETILSLLAGSGRTTIVTKLTDPALWGGPISDQRYLLLSDPTEPS